MLRLNIIRIPLISFDIEGKRVIKKVVISVDSSMDKNEIWEKNTYRHLPSTFKGHSSIWFNQMGYELVIILMILLLFLVLINTIRKIDSDNVCEYFSSILFYVKLHLTSNYIHIVIYHYTSISRPIQTYYDIYIIININICYIYL